MAKTVDYALGEHVYPRGWFMVADAEQINTAPLSVRFFGQDLVIYRGESGKAYMVSAYCPHMRTHIGKNTTSFIVRKGRQIEGESIRCPYHAWRFGPDGQCDHIPYSDIIPQQARLAAYEVVERYNAIFYWHDPEGGPPDYELPEISEWEDPMWVRWRFDILGEMDLHPVEVVDNICDLQHLLPIHATHVSSFETELRGHMAWQRLSGVHEILGAEAGMMKFDTYYTGPGILISRFLGDNNSMMFITHTPVDDGRVFVWHATLTKIADRIPTEEDVQAARDYQRLSRDAFAQDFEIWSNKQPCLRPMQLPGDGNFLKVRTWYKQFYNPRSAAALFLGRSAGIYTVPGVPDFSNERV